MSGPARASADRGPRSARQGGVYSLHTRGRRALCLGAVCLAGLLMAACMHTVLSEPAGFSGTPRSPAPASPSPPQLTGDPDRPYLLQTQPPYTVALDAGHGGEDGGAVSPDGVPESGIKKVVKRSGTRKRMPSVCREFFLRPSDRRKRGKNGVLSRKSSARMRYLWA